MSDVISPWTVYWITRLDDLDAWCMNVGMAFLVFGSMAAGIFVGVLEFDFKTEDLPGGLRRTWKALRITPLIGLSLLVIWPFIPSTKEMCAIIAIPAIANSDTTQEISGEIVDLAREWLDELRPQDD